MHPKARVRGRSLYPGLTGVCLLALFAPGHAKADPLLPPVPPLIGPLVSGGLTIALTGQGLNVDRLGTYRLEEPPGGAGVLAG